jgi:hypothetical protein
MHRSEVLMLDTDFSSRLVIAGFSLTIVIASNVSAQETKTLNDAATGNEAGFINSNATATLDCGGGKAAIVGSNNTLTIGGHCAALELMGSSNKITVEFGANAKIDFVGSNNRIVWKTPDGKPPKVTYVGSDNTLTKGS